MNSPIFQDNDEINAIFIHSAVDDAGLDPFAFRVLMHLSRRANRSSMAYPGIASIAETTKISERQVRRAIEVLTARRMVEVSQAPGKGNRNQYLLTSKKHWLLEPDSQADSENQIQSGHTGRFESATQADSFTREGYPVEGDPDIQSEILKTSAIPEPPKGKATAASKPKGKKKHENPLTLLAEFPEQFKHDDPFVEAFLGWAQDRIDKGNPLTSRGAAIARNKLVKFPLSVAIAALERSTEAGWSGVFPESIGKGKNSDKFAAASSPQPDVDWFAGTE